jgi:ABC-type spermidine/putrescine transport system permease subunit II
MGSHDAGILRRVIVSAIVAVMGALVGLVVGVFTAIVLSAMLWSSDGADEPFIFGILVVLAIVVPIATLAGGAIALRLYHKRT